MLNDNTNKYTGVTDGVKWKVMERERGREHTEKARNEQIRRQKRGDVEQINLLTKQSVIIIIIIIMIIIITAFL